MPNTNAVHIRATYGPAYDDLPFVTYDVWRLRVGAASMNDIEIMSRHEYQFEAAIVRDRLNAMREGTR